MACRGNVSKELVIDTVGNINPLKLNFRPHLFNCDDYLIYIYIYRATLTNVSFVKRFHVARKPMYIRDLHPRFSWSQAIKSMWGIDEDHTVYSLSHIYLVRLCSHQTMLFNLRTFLAITTLVGEIIHLFAGMGHLGSSTVSFASISLWQVSILLRKIHVKLHAS